MVSAYAHRFGAAGRVDWLESHQGVSDLLANAQQYTSAVYQTANNAKYSRVFNPRAFRMTHAYVQNGTVVSGNFDIGVYDARGVKIASTGSTAQAGTSTIQWVALDALIPAGWVTLAFVLDNTTGTTMVPSTPVTHFPTRMYDALGFASEGTAHPLPATLTPVTLGATTVNLPIWGVVKRWP